MGKVLVKSAMYQYQMGPEGLQRYYTLGGSGGRAQPGEVRGRTKRDRALGLAGAMAGGVLGLAGESRSLGGFAGNIISGAEQGSRFGRGLANLATTRTRQARADMREQRRIDDTKQRAAELEERRAQGKGFNLPVPRRDDDGKLRLRNFDLAQLNPMARVRAHNYGVQQSEREALDRANFSQQTQMAANEQLGRELARQGKDEYKQRMKGRQRDAEPVLQAVENINQERIQPALDLLTGLQAPQQQAQAPQGPVQPAAGFNQNDNTVDQQLNAPENRDNQSNSVEAAQAEVSEESQQGGGDEEPPTDNRRLQMLMERMGQQGGEK